MCGGRRRTPQQAVGHALFVDACAALVLAPSQLGGEGPDIIAVETLTNVGSTVDMTWDVTDHGFVLGFLGVVHGVDRLLNRGNGVLRCSLVSGSATILRLRSAMNSSRRIWKISACSTSGKSLCW